MKSFWRFIALFAYRRWARAEGRKPVGVPGNRDPENPCPMYAPRPRRLADLADCMTDGHFLCWECAHRKPTVRVIDGDIVDTEDVPRPPDGRDIVRITLWR